MFDHLLLLFIVKNTDIFLLGSKNIKVDILWAQVKYT